MGISIGKRALIKYAVVILAVLLILIVPLLMIFSSYHLIIKDTESRYYKAKAVLIAGDTLICLKDSTLYKKRKQALYSPQEDYGLAFISMKNIVHMEIIPDTEVDEDIYDGLPVSGMYLGRYRINASGHTGYLYLRRKNGRVYGSIKFPKWAKGVIEPLKGLRIYNGRIRFVRSVTTEKERRRIGASSYFTQKYYGEYKQRGRTIRGYYIIHGSKRMWRADKIK